MANITINEISQNYTYNIGNTSYATVAMPITASWGPGFQDATAAGIADDEVLESLVWSRFPATQAGLESFVSTFRGASTQYMLHEDYSYQVAMTLLTAGYDLLVTRIATGAASSGKFLFVNKKTSEPVTEEVETGTVKPSVVGPTLGADKKSYTVVTTTITKNTSEGKDTKTEVTDTYTLTSAPFEIKAKYLGSFGNNLVVTFRKLYRTYNNQRIPYWNCITYVQSVSGVRTAVENLNFTFNVENSTETILHIDEIESNFLRFSQYNQLEDDDAFELAGPLFNLEGAELASASFSQDDVNASSYNSVTGIYEIRLYGGSDLPHKDSADPLEEARNLAKTRFCLAYYNTVYDPDLPDNYELGDFQYLVGAEARLSDDTRVTVGLEELSGVSDSRANSIWFREWMFTAGYTVLGTLSDKLAYNPNRIIVPGWDDQDFRYLLNDDSAIVDMTNLSPLHMRLMDLAYASRCATAYIDIPRSISRAYVYNESLDEATSGYAQRLARHTSVSLTVEGSIYASHSALFAPWGKYAYVGSSRQGLASPSFLALMIDRAMIKNQTSQYEWELPTTRKHSLNIGKMDYTISKKYLDEWQSLEGVGVNCITQIPDLGLSIWGNSTLYEVPPATYQALANLSTRKLINAIKDLAYRCGIGITFNYNNDQAYNSFYAGMTPLLDTMRNVGAIEDYYLRMSEDVNGLDQINANSVIGAIYLVIDGVINDIAIDLIALPPTSNLDDYRAQ